MSKLLLAGHKITPVQRLRFLALESYVFGPLQINGADVATAQNVVNLVNDVFEMNVVYSGDFGAAIDEMWGYISGLSKSQRKKLRLRNLTKVTYPMKGVMRSRRQSKLDRQKYYSDVETVARAKRDMALVETIKTAKFKHPAPSTATKEEFYKSWEWRTLRMEAIQKHGNSCQCCGAAPGQKDAAGAPVRICVDHIKPISKHWNLRLDLSNLQILCDECNMGKGNWSETDFRPAAPTVNDPFEGLDPAILDQLTDRTTGRLQ